MPEFLTSQVNSGLIDGATALLLNSSFVKAGMTCVGIGYIFIFLQVVIHAFSYMS